LRTPDYDTSLHLATKEYHVFKVNKKKFLKLILKLFFSHIDQTFYKYSQTSFLQTPNNIRHYPI